MKYKSGTDLMNLPNYIKFGCEIEAQNVDCKKLKEEISKYPELKGWKVESDNSLTDNGAEIVSPPRSEKEDADVYSKFEQVLNLIKSCPADKKRRVYIDERCGGHIHFDATMMKKNPEMVESFLRLWAESEELIFKMCNDENNPIRESSIRLTPVDGVRRILFSGISEAFKAADSIEPGDKDILKRLMQATKDGTIKSIKRSIFARHKFSFT